MTAEPAPRVSPWWMAAPALLFTANFVAAALTSTSSTKNAVYSASAIIGTIVVDLVLIGYVLFAVRMSRRPIRPTLAIVRTPLRPAVRLALGALGVIIVANFALEPLLHASQRQGIAPTHWRVGRTSTATSSSRPRRPMAKRSSATSRTFRSSSRSTP